MYLRFCRVTIASTKIQFTPSSMSAVVKRVPPFCEQNPTPAAGSILSSQVELFTTPPPTCLTFQSELPPKAPNVSLGQSQEPLFLPSKGTEKQVRFKHVTVKPSRNRSVTPGHSSTNGSDSESESDTDSVLSIVTDSDNGKIPKPEGEPGRPGRGGYNLERAINWSNKDYKRLKVFISYSLCLTFNWFSSIA